MSAVLGRSECGLRPCPPSSTPRAAAPMPNPAAPPAARAVARGCPALCTPDEVRGSTQHAALRPPLAPPPRHRCSRGTHVPPQATINAWLAAAADLEQHGRAWLEPSTATDEVVRARAPRCSAARSCSRRPTRCRPACPRPTGTRHQPRRPHRPHGCAGGGARQWQTRPCSGSGHPPHRGRRRARGGAAAAGGGRAGRAGQGPLPAHGGVAGGPGRAARHGQGARCVCRGGALGRVARAWRPRKRAWGAHKGLMAWVPCCVRPLAARQPGASCLGCPCCPCTRQASSRCARPPRAGWQP